jgi:broad specificity phosphatase PhoE
MNWGDIVGQSFADFVSLWEQCSNDRTYTPPNGYSAYQAGERLATLIDEIVLEQPNGAIVIVTHGGILSDYLLNRFSLEQLAQAHPQFPEQRGDLITHCSITHLAVTDSQQQIYTIALRQHLA